MAYELFSNAVKRYKSLSDVYKKQKFISAIFRVFPESRILAPDEVKQLRKRLNQPASRRARRALASAGRRRKGSESYDLFDMDFKRGGM